MILYNVTVNIDAEIEQEWLNWMREIHIPEVLATGLILENKILRIFDQEKMDGTTTYAFQYILKSIDDYEKYQAEHAPTLQKLHSDRYNNRFVAFRTIMEII